MLVQVSFAGMTHCPDTHILFADIAMLVPISFTEQMLQAE